MASHDTNLTCPCHRPARGHFFGPDLQCENYRVTKRNRSGRVVAFERCQVTWDLHQDRATERCRFKRPPGRLKGHRGRGRGRCPRPDRTSVSKLSLRKHSTRHPHSTPIP